MARKGGCDWYQSVGLKIVDISADWKNFIKDPGPLNNKKRIGAAKQLYVGGHWIKERPGLKTDWKQNRGAPILLVLHNAGCRRIKVRLFVLGSIQASSDTVESEGR